MKKPIHVSIVGAGNSSVVFGQFIAANPQLCRLLAICDIYREKAEALCDFCKLEADRTAKSCV